MTIHSQEIDLRRPFLIVSLMAAALIIATACAQKTESTAATIPTATPVDTPTPLPTATIASAPTPSAPALAATATPVRPTPTATPTRTPTPSPTPEPSLATAKAAALLVSTLGAPAASITFESIKPMQWPNTAIGCPEPGKAYAEVLVPGWMIILRHDSKLYEYHADREGVSVVTCDPKLVRTYGTVNFAEKLQLSNVSKIEVLALDREDRTPAMALTIDNPNDIAKIVSSLQVDLSLYERKQCEALLRVDFVMGGRVESVLYACQGEGSVLRDKETAGQGREARAPTEFQKLINTALASRPFPSPPADK
ncbi:MAG: hypothetical protein HYY34_04705 [Chloroflexi bacterium]|nr:hypothetical protein [Chloroflexota bacterium]